MVLNKDRRQPVLVFFRNELGKCSQALAMLSSILGQGAQYGGMIAVLLRDPRVHGGHTGVCQKVPAAGEAVTF